MSSDPGLPGLRGLCGRPWPTSITGQSDKTTSHYFLFWVEFIEGSKLIESDTEISTRFRLSDKQRDGSLVSVAGFSPGCFCFVRSPWSETSGEKYWAHLNLTWPKTCNVYSFSATLWNLENIPEAAQQYHFSWNDFDLMSLRRLELELLLNEKQLLLSSNS